MAIEEKQDMNSGSSNEELKRGWFGYQISRRAAEETL